MESIRKIKYIAIGTLSTLIIAPVLLIAADSITNQHDEVIPITFSQGDVLSADVLNAVVTRINTVNSGLSSSSELDGVWQCKLHEPLRLDDLGDCTQTGRAQSKDFLITFSDESGKFSSTSSVDSCRADGFGAHNEGTFDAVSGHIMMTDGLEHRVFATKMLTPNTFTFQASNSSFVHCSKEGQAPLPVRNLTISSVAGTSVTLNWEKPRLVKASDDAASLAVGTQVKHEISGAWREMSMLVSQTTSYIATALPGSNWFRVVVRNEHGDSITSNEVFVEIE